MGKPTLEQLYGPQLRGPATVEASSASGQFAGRTTLASGSATVAVSTTSVKSDSIIQLSYASGDATNILSGVSRFIEVKSINPSNAFILGTADGIAMARDTTVMWLIHNTSRP